MVRSHVLYPAELRVHEEDIIPSGSDVINWVFALDGADIIWRGVRAV